MVDVVPRRPVHPGDLVGIAIVLASIVGANLVQRRQLAPATYDPLTRTSVHAINVIADE